MRAPGRIQVLSDGSDPRSRPSGQLVPPLRLNDRPSVMRQASSDRLESDPLILAPLYRYRTAEAMLGS